MDNKILENEFKANGGQMSRASENETIIRIAADESEWDCYSDIPRHQRIFEKLAIATEEINGSVYYKLPKKCISFRKLREITEDQREKMADRMKYAMNNRRFKR